MSGKLVTLELARGPVHLSATEVDEWARRAVKVFQSMEYSISSIVRVLTKNPRARVVLDAGTPRTDGVTIYYRPPLDLGDPSPHRLSQCDKRDANDDLICPACLVRETVISTITHEVAHITGGSFKSSRPDEARRLVNAGVSAATDSIARAVLQYKVQRTDFSKPIMHAMGDISPYLGALQLTVEDARIDLEMFKARPGTEKMFRSAHRRMFERGYASLNGEITRWKDNPLNAQIIIGILCDAEGYEYSDWLHPKVCIDLTDPQLQELIKQIPGARDVQFTTTLSVAILIRLWEMGYCEPPKEIPPPPEQGSESDPNQEPEPGDSAGQEQGSESSEQGETSGSGGSTEGDPGESGEGQGNPGGDGQPGDSQQSSSDGSDDSSRSSGSREEALESSSDRLPGSNSSDDSSGRENQSSQQDDRGSGESSRQQSESGASDDGGSEGAPGNPGRGGGSSPRKPGGGEADSEQGESGDDDAAPDGAEDNSDHAASDSSLSGDAEESESTEPDASGESSDPRDEDDGSSAGAEPEASDDGDQRGSSGGPGISSGDNVHGNEGDSEDSSESQDIPGGMRSDSDADGGCETSGEDDSDAEGSDLSSSPGDTGQASDLSEDSEDGGSSSLPDPNGTSSESAESRCTDFGADGTDPEPLPDFGTFEDVAGLIEDFTGHDHSDDEELHLGVPMSEDVSPAIDRAVKQTKNFDMPTDTVYDIEVYHWPKDDGVIAWNHERQPLNLTLRIGDLKQNRTDAWDLLRTPEEILQPALFDMRRAFLDNSRGRKESNLKSGKINSRALGKRAWSGDERLFMKKTQPKKKSYAVVIGLDISGSTNNAELAVSKQAAFAQAELCNRMGIEFEIWAHTAKYTGAGYVMQMFQIKGFRDPWSQKIQEGLTWLHACNMNLDGHTVEFYRKRLQQSQATTKILLYYTDGAMPAANKTDEVIVLKQEVLNYKRLGIIMLGVGIGTDSPKQWGMDTVRIDRKADVGKVVKHLEGYIAGRVR